MTGPVYEIRITRRAEKDIGKLIPKLRRTLHEVLSEVITRQPFQGKRLVGDLAASCSHRLTYKDRIVYSIDTTEKIVYLGRAATHSGEQAPWGRLTTSGTQSCVQQHSAVGARGAAALCQEVGGGAGSGRCDVVFERRAAHVRQHLIVPSVR